MGYLVVAVDLYGGHRATTHEAAGALLGALRDDLAAREIDAAIKWVGDRTDKVAAMGFSMGVKHVLAAALRNQSVRATVLCMEKLRRTHRIYVIRAAQRC